MEAKLVIKANDVTMDFIDGIMKVFSKDAVLDITVNYDPEANAALTPTRGRKHKAALQKALKGDQNQKYNSKLYRNKHQKNVVANQKLQLNHKTVKPDETIQYFNEPAFCRFVNS